MKKKIIIGAGIVAILLLVAGVGNWYVTKSDAFYPEHLKIGDFIAVNTTAKCYIYDFEKDEFTGDYFTVHLKTKGYAGVGGTRIGYGGKCSLVVDEEKVDDYDEITIMFTSYDKYGDVTFIANNVEFKEDGSFDKAGIRYTFIYSPDFSELTLVNISEDGKEPVQGYVADSLEEAENAKK